MNSRFGMTLERFRQFSFQLERVLQLYIEKQFGFSAVVSVTRFLPLGYGCVRLCDGVWHLEAGTGQQPCGWFVGRVPVSDLDVIRVCVTAFHELEHLEQAVMLHTGEFLKEEDVYLFCSYYGQKLLQTPFPVQKQSVEIYAEWMGVQNAQTYLEGIFRPEDVRVMLLLYATLRSEESDYVLSKKKYDSYVDLYEAFEETYEWSKMMRRYDRPDAQLVLVHPAFQQVLEHTMCAENQDKLLTGLCLCYLLPDGSHLMRRFDRNPQLDLSAERLFNLVSYPVLERR